MIGAVARFERSLISNARANGKILGRQPLGKLTRKEIAEKAMRVRKGALQSLGEEIWSLSVDSPQTVRGTGCH